MQSLAKRSFLVFSIIILNTGCVSKNLKIEQINLTESLDDKAEPDTKLNSEVVDSKVNTFVSLEGSDQFGDGSTERPYHSIKFAISKMKSGEKLIVKAGIYESVMNSIKDIPSGTALKRTVIKAETPLSVRIKNLSALDYNDHMLNITGDYIDVSGFIFEINNSKYPPHLATVIGKYNRVLGNVFKRVGLADNYSSWLSLNGSYNLAEDNLGFGTARYGFYTGGPSSTSHHNLFRRNLGRRDSSWETNQPQSTYTSYGTDSESNGVHHNSFINSISIDSILGQNTPNIDGVAYGGFYFPKNNNDALIKGCIVANDDVKYAGFVISEFKSKRNQIVDSTSIANTSEYSVRLSSGVDHKIINFINAGQNQDLYNNSSASEINFNINPANSLVNIQKVGVDYTFHDEQGWDENQGVDLFPLRNELVWKELLKEDTEGDKSSLRGWAASSMSLKDYLLSLN